MEWNTSSSSSIIGAKLSSAPNVMEPLEYVSVRALGSFLREQEVDMLNASIATIRNVKCFIVCLLKRGQKECPSGLFENLSVILL